jgi:hypothetical protein
MMDLQIRLKRNLELTLNAQTQITMDLMTGGNPFIRIQSKHLAEM